MNHPENFLYFVSIIAFGTYDKATNLVNGVHQDLGIISDFITKRKNNFY
jgi:hypothetical protein